MPILEFLRELLWAYDGNEFWDPTLIYALDDMDINSSALRDERWSMRQPARQHERRIEVAERMLDGNTRHNISQAAFFRQRTERDD